MSRDAPERPSVPPSVWLAVAWWCGTLAAEAFFWSRFASPRGLLPLVVGGCGIAVLIAVATRASKRHVAAIVSLGVIGGICCGGLFWSRWESDVRLLQGRVPSAVFADVVSDPRRGRFGESSECRVALRGETIRLTCRWPSEARPPEAGESCRFFGTPKPSGTGEWGRRDHQAGRCGSVTARAYHNEGAGHHLQGLVARWRTPALEAMSRIGGDGGSLLTGILLGDTRRLEGTSVEAAFKTTGLTHLVAVSGGHLVVVAALLAWAARGLGLPKRLAAAIVVAVLGLYVVASGAQPSAIRAWTMAVSVSLAGASGRRGDGLAALSAAVIASLAVWPPSAFDLGLRLSVAAVAGLLLFARFAESWASSTLPQIFGWLAAPLSMTFVAQAATLPLTVAVFGMISLVAPIANVLVAPLVSCALSVGLIGLLARSFAPSVGVGLLQTAAAFCEGGARVASALARLPNAAVPLGWAGGLASAAFVLLAAIVWMWWPRPQRLAARAVGLALAIVLTALWVGPVAPDGSEVVVMDVGQGDAILIRDGKHGILIDAGPNEASLRSALRRVGVRSLDAVVITHMHDDHYGGTPALQLVRARVGYLRVRGRREGDYRDSVLDAVVADPRRLSPGDTFEIGPISMRVLSPDADHIDADDENRNSIVVLVRSGDFDMLLTGDAESDVLERLTEEGRIGDVDVLKVGHHGSAEAVSDACLRLLRPEVAIISVGKHNRFRHPAPSTVRLLSESGARVLRTDEAGDVHVRIRAGAYAIETVPP